MRFVSLPVALVAVLLMPSCGVEALNESLAPAAERTDAIVGGTLAMGDPAVVGFAVGNGQQFSAFCTGTLVAPKTMVTAAHCINAMGSNYQYYVIFGTYDTRPTQAIRVASQQRHPMYSQSNYDVGIVELATPAMGVTPIAINKTPLGNSNLGQNIRHVGYGITSGGAQDSGTKREVTYGVRRITPLTIESGGNGKQTCQGDSGGPALMVLPGARSRCWWAR